MPSPARREIAEDEGVQQVAGVTDARVAPVSHHHGEHAEVAKQRYRGDDDGRLVSGCGRGVPGELVRWRLAAHGGEDRVAAVAAVVYRRGGGGELVVSAEPRRGDAQLSGAAGVRPHCLPVPAGEVLVLLERGLDDRLSPVTAEQRLAAGGPPGMQPAIVLRGRQAQLGD